METDVFYIAVSLAVVVLYYARCPVVQSILGGPEIPDSVYLDGLVYIVRCRKFNNNRECFLIRQRTDKPADIYNLAEIILRVAVVGHELLGNPLTVCFIFQRVQSLARYIRSDYPLYWEDDPRRVTKPADPSVPVNTRDFRLLGAAEEEPQIT